MDERQALQVLDQIASQIQMNREIHVRAQQAVVALDRALAELAQRRQLEAQGRDADAQD